MPRTTGPLLSAHPDLTTVPHQTGRWIRAKEPLHDQEVFVSHATHANAALTPRARLRLARLIVEHGWPPARAAERYDVSWKTAAKWAAGAHQVTPGVLAGPDQIA